MKETKFFSISNYNTNTYNTSISLYTLLFTSNLYSYSFYYYNNNHYYNNLYNHNYKNSENFQEEFEPSKRFDPTLKFENPILVSRRFETKNLKTLSLKEEGLNLLKILASKSTPSKLSLNRKVRQGLKFENPSLYKHTCMVSKCDKVCIECEGLNLSRYEFLKTLPYTSTRSKRMLKQVWEVCKILAGKNTPSKRMLKGNLVSQVCLLKYAFFNHLNSEICRTRDFDLTRLNSLFNLVLLVKQDCCNICIDIFKPRKEVGMLTQS